MAVNIIGPNIIQFKYTVQGHQHVMNLSCDIEGIENPGDDINNMTFNTRGVTTPNVATAINDFVALLQPFWADTMSFSEAVVLQVIGEDIERQFITAMTLNAIGTSAGTNKLAFQTTQTYRTQEGNTMKLVLLETTSDLMTRIPMSSYSPPGFNAALRDFIVSDACWIKGRDSSYPISAMNSSSGTNEKLFRKRYRQ